MTGIQALERIAPGLPVKPGKVERCEFEYRRHGTQTLIAGFDVTIGKVVRFKGGLKIVFCRDKSTTGAGP
jgi:hypothetical protein